MRKIKAFEVRIFNPQSDDWESLGELERYGELSPIQQWRSDPQLTNYLSHCEECCEVDGDFRCIADLDDWVGRIGDAYIAWTVLYYPIMED